MAAADQEFKVESAKAAAANAQVDLSLEPPVEKHDADFVSKVMTDTRPVRRLVGCYLHAIEPISRKTISIQPAMLHRHPQR